LNELVIAMGAGDLLAARTDYDTHSDLMGLPSVGGGLNPSVERLVSLGVDLVLTVEGRDGETSKERLVDLGIDVVSLPANTVSDLYTTLDRLGAILDRQEGADSVALSIRTGMESVESRVRALPPVDVMYVIGIDPPMTTGPGTFLNDLIRRAGGRNVFDDSPVKWPAVGFESIIHRNPEVLILAATGPARRTAEDLRGLPGWKDVPAVREGRAFQVDGALFNRPGPRLPQATRILAEALHPEAFRGPAGRTP
jgi:iron complex transport system substrate-binding protein